MSVLMLVKVCTTCEVEKSTKEFHVSSTGRHGVSSKCKACVKKYGATRRSSAAARDPADIPVPDTKYCYKCNTALPSSEFYKNRTNLDGLHGHCKDCAKKYNITRHARFADRDPANIPVPDTKRCTKCDFVLPSSEFHTARTNWDGLNSRCKGCVQGGGTCGECGGACDNRSELCKDCRTYGSGGYNRKTIGRREDRWSKTVTVYLRTVKHAGKTWTKVGIGSKERSNQCAGEVLASFEAPLIVAYYIEQRVLASAERISADKEFWPDGLGGHTECVADHAAARISFHLFKDNLDAIMEDVDIFGLPLERWVTGAPGFEIMGIR